MRFAPFPIVFRFLDQKLCDFKNHNVSYFFMPKLNKDSATVAESFTIFMAIIAKNCWISKQCSSTSRGRSHLGDGAKRIYFIQKNHWKNFQVWVLTRNSSQKNFSAHVKTGKKWKIAIFWDEFLGGSSDFKDEIWSEMESLGVLDVFCTYSECATTFRSNFRKIRFFWWFFGFFICGSNYSNFEIGRYRPGKHDLTLEISSLMLEPHYM